MEKETTQTLDERVAAIEFSDRYSFGQRSTVYTAEFGEVAEAIIRALAEATQADILQTKLAAVTLIAKIDRHRNAQERDRQARQRTAEEQGRRQKLVDDALPTMKKALEALCGKLKPVVIKRNSYSDHTPDDFVALDSGNYAAWSRWNGEVACGGGGYSSGCSRQPKIVTVQDYHLKGTSGSSLVEPKGVCVQHGKGFLIAATVRMLVNAGTLPSDTKVAQAGSRYRDIGALDDVRWSALAGLLKRTGTGGDVTEYLS